MSDPEEKRVAIISGGTRGLGRAISLRLAQDGFLPVTLYQKDERSAESATEELQALCPESLAMRVDVSDEKQVDELREELLHRFGRIDVIVHNAFRSRPQAAKVHQIDAAAWREDIEVNLTGPFLLTRAFLPSMIEAGRGRIVFIGSLAMRGEAGRAAYTVTKNGLLGLARTLAQEVGRHGITANIISPGYLDTGAFRRIPEELQQRALKQVPARRAGNAAEIAGAVSYLCGPDGGYVNGALFPIDGGAR